MKVSRGFTLLELLIGLTLFGFVLGLLLGGFRLASASWDAVTSRTEATVNTQLGRNFTRHLLSQLQPLRWKKDVNQSIAFRGEHASLQAIAALPSQWNSGGLQVIELSVQTDEQPGLFRLVLRHAPLRRDSEQFIDGLDNAGEGRVLLDGLVAAEFNYFGSEKIDGSPRWQNHWGNNPQQLPQLIALRTADNEGGGVDLVVVPMIGKAACRWDSVNNRCS